MGPQPGVKGGEDGDIVLTREAHEQCLRYRDLKVQKLGDCDDNDLFFVNFNGGPLAPFNNTRGSILETFGKATGISNPATNCFRRGAEAVIQADPKLKTHVKKLQSHSAQVTSKYYDRSGEDIRGQFVYQHSEIESPSKAIKDKLPAAVKRKRDELDDIDHEKSVKDAKRYLNALKGKKFQNMKSTLIETISRSFF